ncbi:MAG: Na+/H+ antiporter NhaA [Myxococcota bacterium]
MSGSKPRALQIVQEFSLPLIAGVVAAVAWANLDHHSYHDFIHFSPFGHDSHLNFHFLMNDIFMAFFFGLAAKEITEAVLPGGVLNPPSKAVNPLLGTLGGVLGPIGAYFGYVALTGHWDIANGWGIPTATDIALAWLVARIIFGATHPAVSFLLLLAVADDGIGLGIIAIFYPDPENPVRPIFLLLVALAIAAAFVLKRRRVKAWQPYVLVPGVLSFFGLFLAHLHPALALVPVVPFMPSAVTDEGLFMESEGGHQTDTLNRFEHTLKLPVDLGLFGFGLANAGVEFSSMGPATWAVLGGLVLGKSVGIFGFSALGHAIGFKLPEGMNFASLFVAGMVAALGLTVALFVAGVAFTDPSLQGAAKMGALFSAGVAPVVIVLGRLLGVGGQAKSSPASSAPSGVPASAEN